MYTDLTSFDKRMDELPSLMAKMYDCLQRVTTTAKKVEEKIMQINTAYKGVVRIISSLDRLGVEVKSRISELASLESIFEEHKSSVTVLFEELNNLVTWYHATYLS